MRWSWRFSYPDFQQELGTDHVNCSRSVKSDLFYDDSKPNKCFSRCPPDGDPDTHVDISKCAQVTCVDTPEGGAVVAQPSVLNDSIRFTPAKLKQISSFWIIVSFCSLALCFLNECSLLCSRTIGTGPRMSFLSHLSWFYVFSSPCWMLISQTKQIFGFVSKHTLRTRLTVCPQLWEKTKRKDKELRKDKKKNSAFSLAQASELVPSQKQKRIWVNSGTGHADGNLTGSSGLKVQVFKLVLHSQK